MTRESSEHSVHEDSESVSGSTSRPAEKTLSKVPYLRAAREWQERTGGKVVGYFPVYAPLEIIHAAGCLPVNVAGAMGAVEIERADARMQSFACSVSRSTLELLLSGNLDFVDAMVFSNICDVARNLSGIWTRNSSRDTFYLHLPMRFEGKETVQYARAEFERFWKEMKRLSGTRAGEVALSKSIHLYNRLRESLRRIDRFRQANPHLLGAVEWWQLLEACVTRPVDEARSLVSRTLSSLPDRQGRRMDRVNVLVAGAFCERPPLKLMEVMEQAGCYVLGDDILPSARYLTGDVDEKEEPLLALAKAYLDKPMTNSGRHFPKRSRELLDQAHRLGADGVLFATAKFCEPALYDYVLQKDVLEAAKVPYLHIEYEEKMTAFEQLRSQIETFVESVLFFDTDEADKRAAAEVKA